MKKTREYLAIVDTGTDYPEFSFYSDSRAGSKGNLADARRAMLSKWGNSARNNKIVQVQLKDWQ